MPTQEMYQNDPAVYQQIMKLVVDDWKSAQDTGITLPLQGTVYPIVLGNKGDWSYLVPRFFAFGFFVQKL